jgi:hypothetical protein
VRVDPADGRYVDMNFKPLTGAQLRAAMNLQSANDAVNAVAKRIPIRLRLKVDESQIGRLITECGNGKMMLEVLQVRYNTDPAPAVAAGGGGGGGGLMEGGAKPSFGGAGGMGMMSEEGVSGGGGGGSALGGATAVDDKGEVAIEIFGLIYLFNPPASLSQTNASAPNATPAAAPASNGTVAAPASNGTVASPAAGAAVTPPAASPVAGSNPNANGVGDSGATAPPAAVADPAGNPADGAVPTDPASDATAAVPGDSSVPASTPATEAEGVPADGTTPAPPPPAADGGGGSGGTTPADGGQ